MVYGNRITDVKPLAKLRELRHLDLTQNQIEDLRPLANLTKLESLTLNQNRITDLSPLVNLKSLRVLSLQNNQVVNLRPLTALAQLKELNLGSNNIVGLDGLEAMKALRTLHLTGNQIADLQPLFKLVGLRELELVHNGQLHYPEVAQLQEVLPRTQINHNATQTKIQFINKTSEPVMVRWWISVGNCKPIRTICGRRKGTRRIPMWDTSGCCSIRRAKSSVALLPLVRLWCGKSMPRGSRPGHSGSCQRNVAKNKGDYRTAWTTAFWVRPPNSRESFAPASSPMI